MRTVFVMTLLASILAGSALAAEEMASRKVLGDRVEIMLPSHMGPMPKEMKNLKFPHLDERNSEVYGDYEGECSFLFEYSNVGRRSDVSKLLATNLSEIKGSEVIEVLDSGLETINYRRYYFICSKSKAVDMYMYNYFRGTVLGEKVIHFSFSCPYKDRVKWAPIARQSLDSVKVLKR